MPRVMSAFPRGYYHDDPDGIQRGMTLRDYFAAKAMAGWIADGAVARAIEADPSKSLAPALSQVAEGAYDMADAMLKARERP